MNRYQTSIINVGNIKIGGNNPIIIQSMTNTKTKDIEATIKQILELQSAGCQIVRLACLDQEDAYAIKKIKERVKIPLVADIHFDYKLALIAIESGIDKIRINPGNIGSQEKIKAVVDACKKKNIPIRIGINSGSIEKDILKKYGKPSAEAMIESAKRHIKILEDLNFYDICLSLKASSISLSIEACQKASEEFSYPLHLGITEAGTKFGGTIKSVAGLSVLLNQEIGNTIRISLSNNPVEEISVCKELLKNFGLINNVPNLISCPTCGRIQYDLIPIAKEIEEFLSTIETDINVAIMGCAVNGPDEARHADIGIAGGINSGLLFKKGEIIKKVPQNEIVATLKEEILKIIQEKLTLQNKS